MTPDVETLLILAAGFIAGAIVSRIMTGIAAARLLKTGDEHEQESIG